MIKREFGAFRALRGGKWAVTQSLSSCLGKRRSTRSQLESLNGCVGVPVDYGGNSGMARRKDALAWILVSSSHDAALSPPTHTAP